MKKLHELGISAKWCTVGVLYFAFTPFWGTYAQWFEKDLLYAEAATLQAIFLMEVIRKRSCSVKDGALLAVFSRKTSSGKTAGPAEKLYTLATFISSN